MNNCQLQIVENLVTKASEICDVPVSAFIEQSKKEEHCIARALVWVVCKKDLCLTYRAIGEYFKRDHTTVRSGFLNMTDEMEVNKERMTIYKQLVNG
jgi:chromosomal replication initiation ATPase DnaA